LLPADAARVPGGLTTWATGQSVPIARDRGKFKIRPAKKLKKRLSGFLSQGPL
jgi:hypothetical protein